MGRGGRRSLCSGLNSCTPLQGLITPVSLEIPRRPDPWREGDCWDRGEPGAMGRRVSRGLRKSSSAPTFLLERIYLASLSRMPLRIFFPWRPAIGGIALQTCCCLQRCKGDSVHEFPFEGGLHIAFINDFISGVTPRPPLSFSLSLSFNRFLHDLNICCFLFLFFPPLAPPDWTKMNLCKIRTSYSSFCLPLFIFLFLQDH